MLALFNAIASRLSAVLAQVRHFPLWRSLEPVFDHFLYPFYRTSSKSSFGKLWASILLFTCLYFWIHLHEELPDTLLTMVQTVLVYVFVTKPVQIARDHIDRKDTNKKIVGERAPRSEEAIL